MDAISIFQEAIEKGIEAGNNCKPEPMKVVDMFSGMTAIVKEGPCGFAWVNVKCKARGGEFIRGLKKKGYATTDLFLPTDKKRVFTKSLHGGYTYWIADHAQSYARKKAHAIAFASVLQKYGITSSFSWRYD